MYNKCKPENGNSITNNIYETKNDDSNILFYDNFCNENHDWIKASGQWSVNNRILVQSSKKNSIIYAGSNIWKDYSVEARCQITVGDSYVGLIGRFAGDSFYTFRITDEDSGKVQLYKFINGKNELISSARYDISVGIWYKLIMELN
jgi:hypothetical protein